MRVNQSLCVYPSAIATGELDLAEGLRVNISVQRTGGTERRPRQSCYGEPCSESSVNPFGDPLQSQT